MAFSERLGQLRKERGLTQQGLADLAGVHLTQIQRYESGTAQPTLEVMKKLAVALTASTDWLLFEEDERGPDDELKLQFEALRQFNEDERKTALDVLDGLILKHQARRMVQRTQSQAATRSTAKAAQRGG
ncbi:MAG: helix-turn-helix transcriptional regulator [Gammaproteobacteria bacterium]|nr:helix-turn-helix transcriptional regulator [Gammaproteobacteria bacterium]